MHLALHLDEVLREIVGWLASPAAQLALALACQSLCNMVLQVLWMHGDAWALAMTMPEQYRRVMSGSQGKLVVGAFQGVLRYLFTPFCAALQRS